MTVPQSHALTGETSFLGNPKAWRSPRGTRLWIPPPLTIPGAPAASPVCRGARSPGLFCLADSRLCCLFFLDFSGGGTRDPEMWVSAGTEKPCPGRGGGVVCSQGRLGLGFREVWCSPL